MTALPTLPDVDKILLAVVATVPGVGANNYGTQMPDRVLDNLPFVAIKRIGGAATDPRFTSRATVVFDVWDSTRDGARDTSVAVWTALRDAALSQLTYPSGHIASFAGISEPSELRIAEQAGNTWRFNAVCSLVLRSA